MYQIARFLERTNQYLANPTHPLNQFQTSFSMPNRFLRDDYIESFNGKLRDEQLNGEDFDTLLEAKVLIERWRWEYNTKRPHSSLGYRPPAPEAIQPWLPASATLQQATRAELKGSLRI